MNAPYPGHRVIEHRVSVLNERLSSVSADVAETRSDIKEFKADLARIHSDLNAVRAEIAKANERALRSQRFWASLIFLVMAGLFITHLATNGSHEHHLLPFAENSRS